MATGIHCKATQKWTAALDLSFHSSSYFLKCEERVGKITSLLTRESWRKWAKVEREMEKLIRDCQYLIDRICLLTDGTFSKSYGSDFSSNSGAVTGIGLRSSKVIEYETLQRKCLKCDKGVPKDKHDFPKNCNESASSMESCGTARIFARARDEESLNADVDIWVGDNDSGTYNRVVALNLVVPPQKILCCKHLTKNCISKKLRQAVLTSSMQDRPFRIKLAEELHTLQAEVRSLVEEMEMCQVEDLQKKLREVTHHFFGKHSHCGLREDSLNV